MSIQFNTLKIKQINKETSDTVTLTFEVPSDLKEKYAYTQGQYLTLRFDMEGREIRRSYSLCSSPADDEWSVTVKRVQGGKVSNYIADRLKAGDTIEVATPEGRFYTKLDTAQKKSYFLFAAGSGITPIFSILKTILEKEPMSQIALLYGSRHESEIIFKNQLDQLEKRYEGQLKVSHIISQPAKEKAGGLTGLFKKPVIQWQGKTGRITPDSVRIFLEENPARWKDCEYFICGPGPMIASVKDYLKTLNTDPKKIHIEYFTSADTASVVTPSAPGGVSAKAKIHLDGQLIQLDISKEKTILQALMEAGYDPPYSCTSGSCSTCMAKLISGKVEMDVCLALDEEEVAEGYILTCQSHPVTPELELTYKV